MKSKILFNSAEAAQFKSLTGWVADGRFFGDNEDLARYAGCTHNFCECGAEKEKAYTKCKSCRHKTTRERFLSMPYIEWDGSVPVCLPDGDRYFFDSDQIDDYIADQKEFDEDFPSTIDLVICDPVPLKTIEFDFWADEMHEEWEPSDKIINAVNAFNLVVASEPIQSWLPGKNRTSYSY